MKKAAFLFLLVLFLSVSLKADTYIKIREHTDESYHHGSLDPAVDSENEIWIGDGIYTVIDEDRNMIVDMKGKKIYIIEFADTSYVEADLPLDMTRIVPEELVPRLAMFRTTGEVKKLDSTKKIKGRECQGYQFNSWILYQDAKYYETERTIWSTTDLELGEGFLEQFRSLLFKFSNFSDELVEQLSMIEGFQLSMEAIRYSEGMKTASSSEVIEIEEKDPPAGIYEIPEGYRLKERMSAL